MAPKRFGTGDCLAASAGTAASSAAATASAIANKTIGRVDAIVSVPFQYSRPTLIPTTTTQMPSVMMPSHLPISSVRRSRGVFSVCTDATSWAIWPNSVCMPVAHTTALPRPYVTVVPVNTMFLRSPTRASCRIGASSLVTGNDSPVSGASSHWMEWFSTSRASAGILSPASITSTSPGTSSLDATSSSAPPRSTVIIGVNMLFSASRARSARYSCTKPSTAQNMMITRMMAASMYSPTKAESRVATIRMTMRMFLNWLKKSAQGDAFSSCMSSFGPYWPSRLPASSGARPRCGST